MDAKYLRKLSRKEIQALAKREKIRANLKNDVIIELLVGKYPKGVPRLIAPTPRRIVKTESVEGATAPEAATKDEGDSFNTDTVAENKAIKDNVEDNGATHKPAPPAGNAASTTTSVVATERIIETATQVGRDESRPQAEEKTQIKALQDTAPAAAREAQESRDEQAKAINPDLENNANGGDTAPNSPTGSDSDPVEESAAEIEARRKAKGKARAIDESPEPEEVDDGEFCLEWWEIDEDLDAQLAMQLDAAERARDAALGVAKDVSGEEPGDNAEEKVQEGPAQGPVKVARPVQFAPIDEDYGPVSIIDLFINDAAATGNKYLMEKAMRMGGRKPTPRPTPEPSPVPSRVPSPVPTEVDGASSPRELSPTGSNLSRLQVSSDEPIRGATKTRARQILHCLAAMADEMGDLRRGIEEVELTVHLTKLKIERTKEILYHTRRYRKVIEEHYVEVLKSDERLHNGTHSWWPAQEGEPDRDYSYEKEVSDEPSSSDMVASSSSSSAKGSDPVSEEAENVPIEAEARTRKSFWVDKPGVLPQTRPFRQFSPKGNFGHKVLRRWEVAARV